MHVAIDLDGTLADIHTPSVQRSQTLDAYRPESFTNDEWNEYYHRSMNVWHNHNDEIPLVEPCVPQVMSEIADNHHITILTHRRKVDSQIVEWLSEHNIKYHDLHPTANDKHEFGADLYIDDNPIEAENAPVLLRNQPWNESIEEGYNYRIYSLTEALDEL